MSNLPPPVYNSTYSPLRPRNASLLPLSPVTQEKPPALALSKLSKPLQQPFKDISLDSRLDCWTRSTHVFPAAYPRSVSGSAVYDAVLPTYQKTTSIEDIYNDIRAQNLAAQRRTEDSKVEEPQLFMAVARYFVNSELGENANVLTGDEADSVTLILLHANGLHKETWEPTLAHLLLSPAGKKVKEVWSIDGVQYGDSAILNRSKLGLTMDPADYSRDVLNFILSYLPDQKSSGSSTIPIVLPQLECPNRSYLRLDKSIHPSKPDPIIWRNRKLGLIGQSMGGTVAALAATSLPELFHHVILVDPPMTAFENFYIHMRNIGTSAIRQRDQWENPDEALRCLTHQKDFHSRWDSRVLIRFVEYGLESSQPTKLKCSKLHEACLASDPYSLAFGAYNRLCDYYRNNSHYPFNLSLLLAKPSQSTFPIPALKKCSFLQEVTPSNLSHLMIQETPEEASSFIAKFLLKPSNFSTYKHNSKTLTSKL